jgi:hypothetical protein
VFNGQRPSMLRIRVLRINVFERVTRTVGHLVVRRAWQSVQVVLDSLNEVLAYFAERGESCRTAAAAYVDHIRNDPDTLLRPNSHQIMPEGSTEPGTDARPGFRSELRR